MGLAKASVTIAAPIDLVWSVMLDLAAYREWNPFIYKIRKSGNEVAVVGDDLVLHVRFRSGRAVASPERITFIEPPSATGARLEYEFRGPLHAAGLVRGRRQQLLEPISGESTRYRTEERFRGLLGFAVPAASVQDGFERHAAALKQRAESLFEQAPHAVPPHEVPPHNTSR
jgi:hypothetical protein